MFKTKEQLIIDEFNIGLSPIDICKKYKFTPGTVYYYLHKNNLKSTTYIVNDKTRAERSNTMKSRHSEGLTSGTNHWTYGKLKVRGSYVMEFEVIEELSYYLDQDLTLKEMSLLMQINQKSVTNRLRKFDLQRGIRNGNRHSNWKGGHSKYRGQDWYSKRQSTLIRDNYTCQECYIRREELDNPQHMHVHHITPYQISKDNSLDNLITLCASCHNKREHIDGIYAY